VKIERNGKYGIAVNDRLYDQHCDAVWDPVFNAEGDKLLLRTLQDGKYIRKVIPVSDILS
jgi:hydroxymethylpyrimidine/phosphomethylpyrimidine kinase